MALFEILKKFTLKEFAFYCHNPRQPANDVSSSAPEIKRSWSPNADNQGFLSLDFRENLTAVIGSVSALRFQWSFAVVQTNA